MHRARRTAIWKAIAVSVALLVAILVLSTMRNAHPGLDPRDQLAFERQQAEQRQTLLAAGARTDPVLACAAKRAQRATVQTLYLTWVNHRVDLATAEDREAAAADLSQSITACGGNPDTQENMAHQHGIDLGQAAAQAMLLAGR